MKIILLGQSSEDWNTPIIETDDYTIIDPNWSEITLCFYTKNTDGVIDLAVAFAYETVYELQTVWNRLCEKLGVEKLD